MLASSRQTIRLFYTYHTYSSRQSIQRNGSVKPQLNSFMENLDGKSESEFTRKASVCVTRICPNAAFSYPFKDTESNGPLHRMGLSELQHRFSSWNVQKRWRNHTANKEKISRSYYPWDAWASARPPHGSSRSAETLRTVRMRRIPCLWQVAECQLRRIRRRPLRANNPLRPYAAETDNRANAKNAVRDDPLAPLPNAYVPRTLSHQEIVAMREKCLSSLASFVV